MVAGTHSKKQKCISWTSNVVAFDRWCKMTGRGRLGLEKPQLTVSISGDELMLRKSGGQIGEPSQSPPQWANRS